MAMNWEKEVSESSAMYQGHPRQFFSLNHASFEIEDIYFDGNATSQLNDKKYLPEFIKHINKMVLKTAENDRMANLSNTEMKAMMLVASNDKKNAKTSGDYRLLPDEAICGICNTVYRISEGKRCEHETFTRVEQNTMIAYCDVCGRVEPFMYSSNLNKTCSVCGGRKSKLLRYKKDDPSSYRVGCTNCSHTESLIFYNCNHNGNTRISEKGRFVPKTVRAGAIRHAVVHTVIDSVGSDGKSKDESMRFSKDFSLLFGGDVSETKLSHPLVKVGLMKNQEFWNLKKNLDVLEDELLDEKPRQDWKYDDWTRFLRTWIGRVAEFVRKHDNLQEAKNRYGLNTVRDLLDNLPDDDENDFDEDRFSEPSSDDDVGVPKVTKWTTLLSLVEERQKTLKRFGLTEISHVANIRMIEGLLGWISGSTRKDRIIFDTYRRDGKNIVLVRDYLTEALIFRFDRLRLIHWAMENELVGMDELEMRGIDAKDPNSYRLFLAACPKAQQEIQKMMHTFSHLVMQVSDEYTGLEIQSISEMLDVENARLILFSKNNINCGGFQSAFENDMIFWLDRTLELTRDCPQDPACMMDEGGACNACCMVPEFVCYDFNQNLDRAALTGEERYKVGYLK